MYCAASVNSRAEFALHLLSNIQPVQHIVLKIVQTAIKLASITDVLFQPPKVLKEISQLAW